MVVVMMVEMELIVEMMILLFFCLQDGPLWKHFRLETRRKIEKVFGELQTGRLFWFVLLSESMRFRSIQLLCSTRMT